LNKTVIKKNDFHWKPSAEYQSIFTVLGTVVLKHLHKTLITQ